MLPAAVRERNPLHNKQSMSDTQDGIGFSVSGLHRLLVLQVNLRTEGGGFRPEKWKHEQYDGFKQLKPVRVMDMSVMLFFGYLSVRDTIIIMYPVLKCERGEGYFYAGFLRGPESKNKKNGEYM